MDVTKYPLDFELLEKGTRITREKLEDIFGCAPSEDEWSFKAMKLVADIKEKAGLLARQSKNSIVIMTDAEAAEYTHETFRRGIRKMGTSVRNRSLIDTAQLSGPEMAKFESQSRVMTGTQQAMLAEVKKLSRMERLLECGEEAKAS